MGTCPDSAVILSLCALSDLAQEQWELGLHRAAAQPCVRSLGIAWGAGKCFLRLSSPLHPGHQQQKWDFGSAVGCLVGTNEK